MNCRECKHNIQTNMLLQEIKDTMYNAIERAWGCNREELGACKLSEIIEVSMKAITDKLQRYHKDSLRDIRTTLSKHPYTTNKNRNHNYMKTYECVLRVLQRLEETDLGDRPCIITSDIGERQ